MPIVPPVDPLLTPRRHLRRCRQQPQPMGCRLERAPQRCRGRSLEAPTPQLSSPPEVDRMWLWVYYNKIPIYPIFYLLKGDYPLKGLEGLRLMGFWESGL